jgi:predicted phosphodiesterase
MRLKHFLHFGCWNKGRSYLRSGNTDNASNLTNVMRRLNEKSDEIQPEFIVVAGDNYYPNKIEKIDGNKKIKLKIFNEEDMISGFESLPKNVDVDVIMGNHDYDRNLYESESIRIEEQCKILETEYKFGMSNDNVHISMYKARILNHNTLALMIDTTIYDDLYADDITGCYKTHILNPDYKELIPFTIDNIRKNQADFIRNSIEEFINDKSNVLKNVILFGHHPIIGYKLKKGKTALIDSPGGPLIDFFYNDVFKFISNLLDVQSSREKINYYYLCADLHQYQVGNISIYPNIDGISNTEKMLIKQYIVGTGGAELDIYPFNNEDLTQIKRDIISFTQKTDDREEDREEDSIIYNVEYLMTPNELKIPGSRYGFLQGSYQDENVFFNFITTDKADQLQAGLLEEENNENGLSILLGTNDVSFQSRGGKPRKTKPRKTKSRKVLKKKKYKSKKQHKRANKNKYKTMHKKRVKKNKTLKK